MNKSLTSIFTSVMLVLALSACASTNSTQTAKTEPTLISSPAPFKIGEITPTAALVKKFEAISKISTPVELKITKITADKEGGSKVELAALANGTTETATFTLGAAEAKRADLKENQKLSVKKTDYGYGVWADKNLVAAMIKRS